MALKKVTMPQLGESVTEGTVDRWLKKEGELVRRDEPLVEIVTDKVNAEVPSPFEGRLVRIEVAAGSTVPIGTSLAEFEIEGLEPEAPAAAGPASAAPDPEATPDPADGPGQHRLSPAVRRLAEENDIDLSRISGSGIGGRI